MLQQLISVLFLLRHFLVISKHLYKSIISKILLHQSNWPFILIWACLSTSFLFVFACTATPLQPAHAEPVTITTPPNPTNVTTNTTKPVTVTLPNTAETLGFVELRENDYKQSLIDTNYNYMQGLDITLTNLKGFTGLISNVAYYSNIDGCYGLISNLTSESSHLRWAIPKYNSIGHKKFTKAEVTKAGPQAMMAYSIILSVIVRDNSNTIASNSYDLFIF